MGKNERKGGREEEEGRFFNYGKRVLCIVNIH